MSHILDCTLDIASCFKSSECIKLECCDKSRIGNVDKIIVHDSIYFVLDKRISKKFFGFSRSGRHLFTFGSIGHGLKEYSSICDISLDESNSCIYALCNRDKILVYNFDGKVINVMKLPFFAENMEFQKGKFYFICDDYDKGNLLITDEKFNILNSFFPRKEDGIGHFLIHPLQKCDDGSIAYYRYLDNNIYKVLDDNSLIAAYSVNFGSKELKREDIIGKSESECKKYMNEKRGFIKYFSENKDFAFILFFDENKPCVGVYNKNKNEGRAYPYHNIFDSKINRNYILMEYSLGNVFADVLERDNILMNDKDKDSIFSKNNPILYIMKN